MTTMTVSDARAALLDLLTKVEAGEEVTITRHGRPVAVVVRPDALSVRRAHRAQASAARVRDALATAAADPQARPPVGLSAARADELVRDVRAGRRPR